MTSLFSVSFPVLLAELRWQGGYQTGLFWTLLILLAGFFIWKLLRQEQQLVSRPVGWSLFLLRSLILFLLLITLWQPVFIHSLERERISKLLLAVDVSESMQLQDQHASPAEKLRWARALEWVTPETELLVAPQNEEHNATDEEDESPQNTQEVQDENLATVFKQLSTLSREELVRRTLEQRGTQFQERLEAEYQVEQIRFAGEAEQELQEPDAPPSNQPQKTSTEVSDSLQLEKTDLTQVEQKAIQLSGNQPVAGIVVFTDGQHNQPTNPLQLASSLNQFKIPIYPVIVGSEQRPADIILHEVAAPPAVYLDDESTVTINVQAVELPGQEITVEFHHQGELIEQQSFVTSDDSSSMHSLTFPLQTEKAGLHHYEVRVKQHAEEFTTENNQRHFTQQVLDNTIHALLIENFPRWEFRFLHNALDRDERIELQTILLNPPLLKTEGQDLSPPFSNEIKLDPDYTKSLFADLDLLILGDVSSSLLNKNLTAEETGLFWKQLEQFIAEEGKTLILLPGSNLLNDWSEQATLVQLAPVTNPKRFDLSQSEAAPLPLGMPILPTTIGYGTSFLQFADQPDLNRQVWERLPGHFGVFTGDPKPAADIILEAFPDVEEPALPAMLYQQYGQGQVVWVGLDSTWRWRRRVGDQFHHRFWGQLGRWAIQSKLSVETDLVRFGPERGEGVPGQPIRVHAHFSSTLLDRLAELNPQVDIIAVTPAGGEESISQVPLLPLPSRQQSMTTVIENLTEGEYQFKLKVSDQSLFPEEISAPYVVRPVPSREQTETIANRELLAELAKQTGGKLFELDQLAQIPDIIKPDIQTETWQEQTDLWTHPLWLTLFILCLSAEWLLRKWHGLP
ncbi:MAG: VWA domain-containing protein [Planctomycetaceae bacterium]|nr:VWA domain-containing protein [Planctomycetaceae bacterium]